MNKDTAKDYLPFVIALSEGKTIQGTVNPRKGNWIDFEENIRFDDRPEAYRIKPELMEVYVVTNKAKTDMLSGTYKTEKEAINYINDSDFENYKTVLLLREVTK